MSRLHFVGSSVLGAAGSAMVPISALLLFSTVDYGAFSVPYLIFALGWSMTLSAVCDTWARGRSEGTGRREWDSYSGALLTGAAAAALVTVAVTGFVLGNWMNAVAAGAGVGANIYRLGARFFHSASKGPQAVLASDTAGVAVFVLAVAATLVMHLPPLAGVLTGWALASLASALLFPLPRPGRGTGLVSWVRQRRARIVPLLGESLLMDAGSIGAPLAMAPFLGTANFGAYRSISSVAMPIQLTLDPIRPNISQMPPSVLLSRKVLAVVLGVAALMSAACFAVLGLVLPHLHFVAGALATLAHYAVACTVYVAVGFLGHFYYIVSRGILAHGSLVRGRAIQTAMHILFPFTGLFLTGLDGAIWGFVAANAAAALVWPAFLLRQHGAVVGAAGRA
ncbi:hypothetical protein ACRQ5B_11460 [Pseudarthrobacter sp. L19]|uniref:hypothetical protein n=1 Tax=Pseudarthrobacter sp. L19 TaxID=3423951 RepID=UPI003D7A313A